MKTIFGLFKGEYSDWDCLGYYTTSEEAEKAAIALSRRKDEYDWIQQHYVVPLECLDGKNELYSGKVTYVYNVTFSRRCSQRTKDYTECNCNTNVRTFAEDDKDLEFYTKNLGVIENLQKKTINPFWSDTLICTWTNTRYLNEEEMTKIAYDMIAKWKAEKAGI